MKKLSFGHLPQGTSSEAHCAHQAMMEMVITEGYATKEWQPMWAHIIKNSGISDVDLERLIRIARTLPSRYSPAGFVRNRLIRKDWISHF